MNSPDDRRGCGAWRTVAAIFVIAVAMNYVWEVAQASLYVGMDDVSRMLWHCFAPSLGDGALALLIFFIGWAALRQRDWFTRPGVRGYALMLVTGLAIAVSVELVAVYALGQWAYTARMPIAPGLGVGLAPVAQMLVLPPIIFRVAASWVAPVGMNGTDGNGSD
jgi:hypothetical protein